MVPVALRIINNGTKKKIIINKPKQAEGKSKVREDGGEKEMAEEI